MLSIIIPTLNEQDYLPKLLDSLQAQEGTFEILVTDGDSSDGTRAVVEDYAKRSRHPIRFLQSGKAGLAFQKNLAVKEARYAFLLYLDADVVLPEGFLAGALKEIAGRKLAFAGTRIYSAEPDAYYRWIFWVYSTLYLPFLRLFKPVVNGCSMFIAKDLHYQIGEFPEGVTFEDYLYSTRAARFRKPALLRTVHVKTSARRFYRTTWREKLEIYWCAIYNVFKPEGPDQEFMQGFREKYGKHGRPKY
jgi:glycosyltransferase involved in cell wall biosynthesis